MSAIFGLTSRHASDGEQWVCTCGWKSEPSRDEHTSMQHALQHWDFHDPEEQP